MVVKKNSKLITFVCEAKKCSNEKTIYKSVYDNYKSHACCRKCAAELKKLHGKTGNNIIIEKISAKQKIDEYFQSCKSVKTI